MRSWDGVTGGVGLGGCRAGTRSAGTGAALLELPETGRPWTGRITYLVALTTLASLTSVLGARNPGSKAWAILMVLLVVVLLIPWLEAGGRLRRAQGLGQVQLDSPWTLFYGLLVVAGVTNFLPTRYGPTALAVGSGLVAELVGLTQRGWSGETRALTWSAVVWLLALGWWLADWSSHRPMRGGNDLERLWFWFRDHWGVVWALRIQERFNRTAELSRWPVRLSWFGLARVSPSAKEAIAEPSEQARLTLRGLIRRFVTPERLAALFDAQAGELAVRHRQQEDDKINSSAGRQVS